MSATIIDGQKVAGEIRAEIAQKVQHYKMNFKKVPGIAVILIGDDPASQVYVSMKEKAAKEAGIHSVVHRTPEDISENALLQLIEEFNSDESINGILVQLPLPKHIDESKVIMAIKPEKDVDGFHPINIGKLSIGEKAFIPCTPYGVMKLLEKYNIQISGKNAVIVGRSNIVGKPMAALLIGANATVTVCHSKTADLKGMCRQADILVAAVGRPRMITGEYIKPGATVIDVGINRVDGKLCGDVDFDSAAKVASAITPVPKGVGPMTIAMLMQNTLESFERTL